jgi:hypothetical protein
MKPIASQSGAVRIFDLHIDPWRHYEAIRDMRLLVRPHAPPTLLIPSGAQLSYGFHPFWGLDIGSDWPNLLYITQILKNPKNPLLDIHKLLPNDLTAESPLDAIPKCLLYFDSEDACRKCLLEPLHRCVQAFLLNISELAKQNFS